jgi:hypothetical protein
MRKLIGMTTASIATLTILGACSSTYRRPESIDDKIARYETKRTTTNKVPELQVVEGPIASKKTRSRGPASVPTIAQTGRAMANFSNKRLYFLTLLTQYNNLQTFVEGTTPPQVNICPAFHTSLVNHNQKTSKSENHKKLVIGFNHGRQSLNDQNYVALFPELSLPLTPDNSYPRVLDMLRKSERLKGPKALVTKALGIHLSKTYHELSELCESGSSDNYYTFENLITQIKNQSQYGANNESVKMLFKTTIFANKAIIHSLESHTDQGRFPASADTMSLNYYSEITHRLKADWTKSYFKKLDGMKKAYQPTQSSTEDVEPVTRRKSSKDPFVLLERTKDRRS